MTMRYAHLAPAVKHEAVAVLDLPPPADGHRPRGSGQRSSRNEPGM
jgi:hypothetical protein